MTEEDQNRIYQTRNGPAGKSLTDGQFQEALFNAGIIKRNIEKSGAFKKKLTDYAHAFARDEKFDQVRGETIIRDVFQSRYGQTMHAMLEAQKEREASLQEVVPEQFAIQAKELMSYIVEGETMPVYKAYDISGTELSREFGISEYKAKELMTQAYEQETGNDLYTVAKEAEKTYHDPIREKERAQSKNEQSKTQSKFKSYSKSRVRA